MMTIEANGRSYLAAPLPVRVYDKPGVLIYATVDRDGERWLGVRLDGEGARIDEWQPAVVVEVRS